MIKIRYSDLPSGLHVRADAQGRHTIIYLLPGLTPAQRRAALYRARRDACLGYGPKLPAAGFARAVAADRLRITLGNGASTMRAHPAVYAPPLILLVSAALAYAILSSVTIRYQPQAVGPGTSAVPIAPGQVSTSPAGIPGAPPGNAHAPGSRGSTAPGKGSRKRTGGSGSSTSAGSSPSTSASPTPGPGEPSPQAPNPSPPGGLSPSPSPSPSGSGGNGGVCVRVGPLGVCLDL